MSTPATLNPIYLRYPFELRGQPEEVVQAHRYAFQQLVDVNQAIAALNTKVNANTSTMAAAASTTSESVTQNITGNPIVGLGGINDQTGSTSYTVTAADNGILLILNDASAVALTLNSALVTPYFFFVSNFGTGIVTATPTTGLVNGAASFVIPQGGLFLIGFDGVNWKTSDVLVLAQTFNAVTHEWLNSYNAATGVFTATRPAYTDLTGTPTLPSTKAPVAGDYLTGYDAATGLFSASTTPGLSVTITTAALTVGGTQGSMTFTAGLLTASTPAT